MHYLLIILSKEKINKEKTLPPCNFFSYIVERKKISTTYFGLSKRLCDNNMI